MMNNILLLTHEAVGSAMLNAARHTLGMLPPNVYSIAVNTDKDLNQLLLAIENILNSSNNSSTLILTDLFGSTPCNIATKLTKENKVAVISGVNLGMLFKAINYYQLPLASLIEKVVAGGKECIKVCEKSKL